MRAGLGVFSGAIALRSTQIFMAPKFYNFAGVLNTDTDTVTTIPISVGEWNDFSADPVNMFHGAVVDESDGTTIYLPPLNSDIVGKVVLSSHTCVPSPSPVSVVTAAPVYNSASCTACASPKCRCGRNLGYNENQCCGGSDDPRAACLDDTSRDTCLGCQECRPLSGPATCGDANGPAGPGSTPVTNADCGSGFERRPSSSSAKCVNAGGWSCDPTNALLDRSACCISSGGGGGHGGGSGGGDSSVNPTPAPTPLHAPAPAPAGSALNCDSRNYGS